MTYTNWTIASNYVNAVAVIDSVMIKYSYLLKLGSVFHNVTLNDIVR